MLTAMMPSARTREHGNARGGRGFTLVEILVSLVVLTIGLLGIAMLQILSKRSNFEAVERTVASNMANFIIERMRANPGSLTTYAGTQESPLDTLGGGSISSEPTPTCGASTSTCTTAELAGHDRWLLEQMLDNTVSGLVKPRTCLTTSVPGATTDRTGAYTVTIVWRGATELVNLNTTNTCGATSGEYDRTSGDNAHRRILAVTTYITTAN